MIPISNQSFFRFCHQPSLALRTLKGGTPNLSFKIPLASLLGFSPKSFKSLLSNQSEISCSEANISNISLSHSERSLERLSAKAKPTFSSSDKPVLLTAIISRPSVSITLTFSKPAFFAPSIVPFPASILLSSSITIERAAPYFSNDFCINEAERSVLLRAFLWSPFKSLILVI